MFARSDAAQLGAAVAGLLSSLRASLARGTAVTASHLALHREASEGVVESTRDTVRTASAFVGAAVQLGSELEVLEHFAEQTCARRRGAVCRHVPAHCVSAHTECLPCVPLVCQAPRSHAAGRAGGRRREGAAAAASGACRRCSALPRRRVRDARSPPLWDTLHQYNCTPRQKASASSYAALSASSTSARSVASDHSGP